MKHHLGVLFLFAIAVFSCSEGEQQNGNTYDFKQFEVNYPTTEMDTSVSDDYHGEVISDPYRWLEDDNSEQTKAWVNAENQVTNQYLEQIPYRDAIQKRLKDFWNYERYNAPFKKGDFFYFFKNDGLQNQAVMYRLPDLNGTPEVALDPNTFSEDGTASLTSHAFSKDGKYLAYQVSEGGSDWVTIKVKNMETGENLPDAVEWVKFSDISWSGDGFFYSRYPAPEGGDKLVAKNEFHKVYFHKLNTSQDQDELVYEDKNNPQRNFYTKTVGGESLLAVSGVESTSGNALFVKPLDAPGGKFQAIVPAYENGDFVVVYADNGKMLVHTNYNAPNWRLVEIDINQPGEDSWVDVLAETPDVLQSAKVMGGKLVAKYLHNVTSEIKVFSLDGKQLGDVELPGIGTVRELEGEKDGDIAFFEFESFTQPLSIYQFDLKTFQTSLWKKPSLDFDSDLYETKQIWYDSKDGTKIPMFIVHKKGLKLDGTAPTLLYGYGGFDISILPGFNVDRLSMMPIFLENNGVAAVANIRGGGEFGSKWHWDGTKEKKQNVFDDFIAAAEYLIAEKYTSSEKLTIYGRSNGGLLVGACMTQRPDLYQVALPAVGVLDMLRYHQFTIGWAWATDYGRSDDPDAFKYLKAYSPLHNIKDNAYPATMITTADHDDRVVPAHSFKFAANLQAHQQGEAPALIRIETSAGHGAGKPTSKKIQEGADLIAFSFWNTKSDIIYDDLKD
ncbi:MAG: S9 family peptidase [Saprospiraceae bacterium]|nr:S9 family peptidase [Saprospiraceae bacterium]